MNINYIPCGDYLIPEFAITMETESLGKYGRMRHTFLLEHCPGLYQQLVLSGQLRAHLLEIDQTCRQRMERIISRMAQAEGVDEWLKASDQLGWIGRMNSQGPCRREHSERNRLCIMDVRQSAHQTMTAGFSDSMIA